MLEKKIINIAVHGVGTIGKRHLMAMNENQNVGVEREILILAGRPL